MEGAAQTLVRSVGQLVGKEFQQLRGVGRQVATLRDELATMNAILRMHSEADDGSVDHFVREWMKQIRELASDGEDCVDLYVFRMRRRASDGFVRRLKRLGGTLFRRRRLAAQIQELRDRAVAISDRHARYGVGRDALGRAPSLNPEPAMRASVRSFHRPANEPYQLVGMDEQADALIERMMKGIDDNDGDKELKVFSIVGFGGLGKTTMAMEVCRRLETEFQRQANVSVSQTFEGSKNLQSLLRRILQQIVKARSDNDKGIKEELTVGDIDTMSVQQLQSTLKNTLTDKRYLIVIDDVWAIAAWDLIRSRLPDNNCGSRIIVTTRIEAVAKACCVSEHYIHPIQHLNPQDSQKLFASRAFGSMDARCPEGLEAEMAEILKKCGGLPLAIVSLASLLESYSSSGSKHMWERICRSIGSQMESNPTLNGMRQILTLSYNHLPFYLKGCMLYLSNFPEDYVIEKDRLLNRWIAEGLVPRMRGLTLLEVAEACFEELMSRNMIDRGTDIFSWYDGRVETCRVHDMMLEVMVSKSLEVNFVSLIGGQYEGMSYDIDRIRRLSIHGVEEDSRTTKKTATVRGSNRSGTEDMNVQHVRSLSLFEVPAHKLLDRLGEFELLRVLDMEGCAIKTKHLRNICRNICRMYLLKFLSLKSTNITSMPAEVGELEHLQTLDVRSTLLRGLPDTVVNLEKLERLLFSNRSNTEIRWMMPRGVKKMKALREVSKVVLTPNLEVAKEIGELDQLEKLGIYVNSNMNIGMEVLEAFAISLSNMHFLRWLIIGDIGYTPYVLNFLHQLPSPPRLLRYLRIAAQIDGLPGWVGTLTNLVEFTMSWGHLVDDQLYEVLCKLPNLESIIMEGHCYTGEALVARSDYKFPVLRDLQAFPGCEFPGVYKFEQGSMTMVETLSVSFHQGFDRKIYGWEHLPNLKEVQLYGHRDSSAMRAALEELSKESKSRDKSKQFKIVVKYD